MGDPPGDEETGCDPREVPGTHAVSYATEGLHAVLGEEALCLVVEEGSSSSGAGCEDEGLQVLPGEDAHEVSSQVDREAPQRPPAVVDARRSLAERVFGGLVALLKVARRILSGERRSRSDYVQPEQDCGPLRIIRLFLYDGPE